MLLVLVLCRLIKITRLQHFRKNQLKTKISLTGKFQRMPVVTFLQKKNTWLQWVSTFSMQMQWKKHLTTTSQTLAKKSFLSLLLQRKLTHTFLTATGKTSVQSAVSMKLHWILQNTILLSTSMT